MIFFIKQTDRYMTQVINDTISLVFNKKGIGVNMTEEGLKELIDILNETSNRLKLEKQKETERKIQTQINFRGKEYDL